MTAWIIPLSILALLTLLCLTRVTVHLVCRPPVKKVRFAFGLIGKTFDLTRPTKKPRVKKAEKAKKKKKQPEDRPGRPAFTADELRQLVFAAFRALGRLLKAVRVDRLDALITVAADDPADAALRYGMLNILWHSLRPQLHRTALKRESVHLALDCQSEAMSATCDIKLSIRLGVPLAVAVRLVYIYMKMRIIARQKG